MFVKHEVDSDSWNCPMCGRPLWPCVSGEASRYCESCNEKYQVKEVKK